MLPKKIKKLIRPNPQAQTPLRKEIEDMGGLDKKDLPAMLIAAFLVILPATAAALGVICLLARFLLM